ncbi:MAG: sodium:proline symporter, partial [Acidimicrobiales bacterium]
PFAGSLGGRRLAAPVTAIGGAPGSQGYWLAGTDGGVYAQGAPFAGSLGGNRLAAPIIGLAAPPR